MNRRRLVTLLLAVAVALGAAVAWTQFRQQITIASLALAVITQPRAEVVISGYLNNANSPAFSLETILIEEPAKEPYRRQIALDADRKFELALGPPVAGAYRASAQTRQATWRSGVQEGWLKTPELVVALPPTPQTVAAVDYEDRRLYLFATMTAAALGVLLGVGLWPR